MANRFDINPQFMKVWDGNPVATFSFRDNESGLEYSDFKLFKRGDGGYFVKGATVRSYEKDNGDKVYIDSVKAAYVDGEFDEVGNQFFHDVAEAAVEVYEELSAGGSKPQRKKASGGARKSAAAGRAPARGRSGRGPVQDSDLPF